MQLSREEISQRLKDGGYTYRGTTSTLGFSGKTFGNLKFCRGNPSARTLITIRKFLDEEAGK